MILATVGRIAGRSEILVYSRTDLAEIRDVSIQ